MSGGHQSKLHADIIRRICAANPTAKTRSFYDELTRHVIAESGEITMGLYCDAIADPYALTASAFERRYLDYAKRFMSERAGYRAIPDAYQLPENAMHVVVWEVSVTNSAQKAIEKWDGLAIELDGYDPWSFSVISVDMHGVATYDWSESKPSSQQLYRWCVDEPCPIDWSRGTKHTDRVELGGVRRALAARLAHARLTFDRRLTESDEAAE